MTRHEKDLSRLESVAGRFSLPGRFLSAARYGSGHINDTWAATYVERGGEVRYVHQRINSVVFPDPEAVMDNVSRVIGHLRAKSVPSLELVPALDGRPFCVDDAGGHWRTYVFIEGAKTVDVAENARQVRELASTFGQFQRALADLPPPLHETIAGFHDTAARYAALLEAAGRDPRQRAASCRAELEFARSRSELSTALTDPIAAGTIPQRITHNDTKINNVMFDPDTDEGICVIDLDTVMPGSVLYDFGDMVRTATISAPEDESDLSRVSMDETLFAALAEGYADATANWLEEAEIERLALSARVITWEVGIRFLTDYLEGDNYFRIGYPEQNLVRCRSQFALLRDLEEKSARMDEIVRAAFVPAT